MPAHAGEVATAHGVIGAVAIFRQAALPVLAQVRVAAIVEFCPARPAAKGQAALDALADLLTTAADSDATDLLRGTADPFTGSRRGHRSGDGGRLGALGAFAAAGVVTDLVGLCTFQCAAAAWVTPLDTG